MKLMLERAIVGIVKQNQDGHHFTQAHLPGTIPMCFAIFDQMLLVLWFKSNSKLVQIIEKCNDIHLRQLAPKLTILNPKQLSDALKFLHPPTQ